MAAVHQHGDIDTRRHGHDEHLEDVVIDNLSRALEIHRNQGLVVTVLLVAILVGDIATMAGVVNEDTVICSAVLRNSSEGVFDIFSCRIVILVVIHEDEHVLLGESLLVDEVILDVEDIVVATAELSLLSNVIDPDEDGTFGTAIASRLFGHNFKLMVDIEESAGGKLRHLIESFLFEDLSHASQQLDPCDGLAVEVVEDAEQGGCAGASSLACRVRQFECIDVGDICGCLGIFRATEHDEFGRDGRCDLLCLSGHGEGVLLLALLLTLLMLFYYNSIARVTGFRIRF
mmetsp:Transcript_9765/g.26607  ORF Transcript_9765/g.26607 Transcript_9765/m.26607 type:complete len:288 (+) Transcript_9765:1075-1938(+)